MLKQSERKERGREGEGDEQEKGEGESGEGRESISALKFSQPNNFINAVSSHHSPGGQSSDLPKFYFSTPNISSTNQARNAEGADQKNKALIIIIGLH